MIAGTVTASREPVVSLPMKISDGSLREIDAVIDTGFTGYLTLPNELINEFGCQWLGRGRAILANGAEEIFDIYAGVVVWNGSPRDVEIDAAETAPLLGMGMLQGCELRVQVVDGGVVSVEMLS